MRRQQYIYKIQDVINYILGSDELRISKHEINRISKCSYRNFQRIFKNITSESIESFSKKFRLEKAYKQIIYSKNSITEIGINLGYSNLQSFSKAFKKQFNISPTEARIYKEYIFHDFIKTASSDFSVEKVFREPKIIYYKAFLSKNYDNNEINKVWDEIELNKVDISTESYGIIENQPVISKNKHLIYGFALGNICKNNDDYIKKEIFGGYYLKFTHNGDSNLIEETYKKFYKYWLQSNFELKETSVIEHYTDIINNSKKENESITDIYFPLK